MVDTIGLNDKTQTDRFGTPHSDRMHVVERFRARPPIFEEQVCAENNRFVGLVFDGGRPTTTVYTPTAGKPDF